MFLITLFTVVGAALGWSISVDWSNHPMFPVASVAFVAFWTMIGGVAGFLAGRMVDYWFHRQ